MRYNMYPAAPINGSAGPAISSGQAIDLMEHVVEHRSHLVDALRMDRAGACCNCRPATRPCCVFVLAVVLVFLVLAAQYESWSLPLAVILVVPMCLLCSIAGVLVAQMDINIFTQVGFVVLVGLACKNAILIVEFAKRQREAGHRRYEATLDACQLRLRPIMMTSFAFILGVVPLVLCRRGRRRNAPHAGHGRLRRHARRDAVRHLPDAGVLLRDPMGQRFVPALPPRESAEANSLADPALDRAALHGHLAAVESASTGN